MCYVYMGPNVDLILHGGGGGGGRGRERLYPPSDCLLYKFCYGCRIENKAINTERTNFFLSHVI